MVFLNSSYLELQIPENSLIYCDPPYNTEATKGKYKDNFNHTEFWDWCRQKAKEGHIIFVSEYNAPNDFKCVWEMKINQRMNNASNTSTNLVNNTKTAIFYIRCYMLLFS